MDEIKKHTLESTVSVCLAGGTILKPASEWGVRAHHGKVKLEFTTGGTETRPINTAVRYLIKAE